MRKFLGCLCLGLCLTMFSMSGCASPDGRSTIFSKAYWKRHANKIAMDLHEFRVDIDRIFFDLEDRPIEDGY